MKGSRPEQAALSRDTDMSKTDATRAVIEGMVDGLNDHRIDDIGTFFAEGFRVSRSGDLSQCRHDIDEVNRLMIGGCFVVGPLTWISILQIGTQRFWPVLIWKNQASKSLARQMTCSHSLWQCLPL